MAVNKGDLFIHPFKGKNRTWQVKAKNGKRWRAEIIEGRYAGRMADFDESHVSRMISIQKILKGLAIGQVRESGKGNVHR